MNVQDLLLEGKGTLIDVREKLELIQEGSVPNAVHIRLGEIENQIEKIKAMKKPIILFCKSGNRSEKAINFLENEGIEGLYNGMGFKSILEFLKNKK